MIVCGEGESQVCVDYFSTRDPSRLPPLRLCCSCPTSSPRPSHPPSAKRLHRLASTHLRSPRPSCPPARPTSALIIGADPLDGHPSLLHSPHWGTSPLSTPCAVNCAPPPSTPGAHRHHYLPPSVSFFTVSSLRISVLPEYPPPPLNAIPSLELCRIENGVPRLSCQSCAIVILVVVV